MIESPHEALGRDALVGGAAHLRRRGRRGEGAHPTVRVVRGRAGSAHEAVSPCRAGVRPSPHGAYAAFNSTKTIGVIQMRFTDLSKWSSMPSLDALPPSRVAELQHAEAS